MATRKSENRYTGKSNSPQVSVSESSAALANVEEMLGISASKTRIPDGKDCVATFIFLGNFRQVGLGHGDGIVGAVQAAVNVNEDRGVRLVGQIGLNVVENIGELFFSLAL